MCVSSVIVQYDTPASKKQTLETGTEESRKQISHLHTAEQMNYFHIMCI